MSWFDFWYPSLYATCSYWSKLIEQSFETMAAPLEAGKRPAH